MELAFGNAWLKLNTYFGTSAYLTVFIVAFMYLVYKGRKKRDVREKTFVWYSIIFWLLYFLPPTAYVIATLMIGQDVYWRMFWLLPDEIIIAYALTKVISSAEGRIKKAALVALGALVIVSSGVAVYDRYEYADKLNLHKLDSETLALCTIIEDDSSQKGIEPMVVVADEDVLCEVRIYDANIKMPYGRNALRAQDMDERSRQLFDTISQTNLSGTALAFYMERWDIPYVIYPNDDNSKAILTAAGFEIVGEAGENAVYALAEDYSDVWLITQYGDYYGNQQMCYVIQNIEGYTILVDGGMPEYEESVRYVLKMLGNDVDAWILTHPHDDHISVFNAIYKNPDGIKIGEIYTVDMADPELIMEEASWDSVDAYNDFLSLGIEDINYVHKGDVLDFDGLTFTVLNAYDEYVDELSDDLLNDGSMMFKIENKEQSMLFCSDVGKKMSEYLLEEYGDFLKSDYLQMGHHGNGGLKADFYRTVAPSVALFDAPYSVWTNQLDRYTTVENRKLLRSELGAAVYCFETAPNSLPLR
ncbi:MAG: MBL fold metallo-hydrolase [Lachnospiraceae bacterium]|nr:MBL fold metallo-hydrolase [Lachnospiraceae bacterium]